MPARSEVVVWGRARAGPGGKDYLAMVEGHQEPSTVSIAKTLAVINNGRVPIRIRNLNPFSVSLDRYHKLGKLFHVEETDVFGTKNVSLTPDADGAAEVGLIEACVHTVEGEPSDLFDLDSLTNKSDLTEEEQDKVKDVLRKWEKVFATHDEDFGRTGTVKHKIPTGDSNPVRERFRPLPPMMYKEVRALLSDMLEKGVICKSSSPWAAPIVLVRKKDGSWRFCVDYRKLNSVTHKDAFLSPELRRRCPPSLKRSGLPPWTWRVGIGKWRWMLRTKRKPPSLHHWVCSNSNGCHFPTLNATVS